MEHRPELPLYRDLNSSAETLSEVLTPHLRQALALLHQHYPFCSLLAEWVTTHQDQAVVRAVIQAGSTCLATAMAAAERLEDAEDQAKLRAIATLLSQRQAIATPSAGASVGIPGGGDLGPANLSAISGADDPTTSPSAGKPPLQSQSDGVALAFSPTAAIAPPADLSRLSTVPPSVAYPGGSPVETPASIDTVARPGTPQDEAAFLQTVSWDEFESDSTEPSAAESPVSTPPLDTPVESAKPSPAKRKSASQPSSKKSRSSSSKSDGEADPTEEDQQTASPSPEGPTDLSDIIARTSVELKRLGWTNVQGREYLQKAYGKRSRQQLTDPELLDFLNYLEAQPSPNVSPF